MATLPMSVNYGSAPQDDEAEIAALEAKLAPAIQAQKQAQARVGVAQLGQGVLGLEDTLSRPFAGPNVTGATGANLVANAQGGLADASNTVRQLTAARDKAVAESPNSPRAKAVQAAVAKLGIDASGLSAQDINANNLLPQGFISQRADAQAKTAAERDAADREFAQKQLDEKKRHALAMEVARGRKSGGGGGASSLAGKSDDALKNDAVWLEAASEGSEAAKKAILSMGPKEFSQFRKANTQKIVDRIASGEKKAKEDANKLELTIKKTAQTLGAQRAKLRIDDDTQFIDDAIRNIAENKDDFKDYLAFGKGKEFVTKGKAFFGDARAAQLQSKFNELKRSIENYSRERSGAAISAKEWTNFKDQLGAGAFASPDELVAGLNRLKRSAELKDKNLFAGYQDAGKEYARTLVNQGVKTPWLKDIAGVQTPAKAEQKPSAEQRVHVINASGQDVTLPASQVEAALATGRYKLPGGA